ncbi:hypothetical protein PR003_g9906 [Phytophthora rubi]|uniref:Uncharacterized protein n=1 Tax=Phytophthora rubi TaxID=129364 RepID=A0A6A4FSU3_9STRA|nr:hypothetical protein PR001_g13197 [Phytophthora rubi]KAE9341588.1 hypothetical protein PR003_g9906 [Phytophthora rubi]
MTWVFSSVLALMARPRPRTAISTMKMQVGTEAPACCTKRMPASHVVHEQNAVVLVDGVRLDVQVSLLSHLYPLKYSIVSLTLGILSGLRSMQTRVWKSAPRYAANRKPRASKQPMAFTSFMKGTTACTKWSKVSCSFSGLASRPLTSKNSTPLRGTTASHGSAAAPPSWAWGSLPSDILLGVLLARVVVASIRGTSTTKALNSGWFTSVAIQRFTAK